MIEIIFAVFIAILMLYLLHNGMIYLINDVSSLIEPVKDKYIKIRGDHGNPMDWC